jgi:hypothetical protein
MAGKDRYIPSLAAYPIEKQSKFINALNRHERTKLQRRPTVIITGVRRRILL